MENFRLELRASRRSWRATRRASILCCLAVYALACLSSLRVFAQQSGTAPAPAGRRETAPPRETDLTISISKVNGQPGNEVSVPVLVARKEGTQNITNR